MYIILNQKKNNFLIIVLVLLYLQYMIKYLLSLKGNSSIEEFIKKYKDFKIIESPNKFNRYIEEELKSCKYPWDGEQL